MRQALFPAYRLLVGSYRKPAVYASAQIEGGNAIDVEIVPAPGTACSGYKKNGNGEDNAPDAKNHGRLPVRMGQGQR